MDKQVQPKDIKVQPDSSVSSGDSSVPGSFSLVFEVAKIILQKAMRKEWRKDTRIQKIVVGS